MVVRLRLARHGTRNNPFYHLVAINDSKPRDARPIEKLGEYDPIPRPLPVRVARAPATLPPTPSQETDKGKARAIATPKQKEGAREGYGSLMTSGLKVETVMQKRIEWNQARIKYWLGTGAQPSKPVARLLHRAGLIPPGMWFKGMPPQPESATAESSTTAAAAAPAAKEEKKTPKPKKAKKALSSPAASAILKAVGAKRGAKYLDQKPAAPATMDQAS